jgi:uncharacterized protein (TIGR02265 family)
MGALFWREDERRPGTVERMAQVFALQSLFEGMFVHAIQPEGAFRAALKEKGFDLAHRLPRYPAAVWRDCADVAVRKLYPEVPRDQAWELLGERFADGYFQTLIGKMINTTLPFLPLRTFLMRSPRFIATGLEGAQVTLEWTDARTALLVIEGPGELASHLMAGVFRNAFRRMKVTGVELFPRALEGLHSELRTVLP